VTRHVFLTAIRRLLVQRSWSHPIFPVGSRPKPTSLRDLARRILSLFDGSFDVARAIRNASKLDRKHDMTPPN
jgi:hypothetical protein